MTHTVTERAPSALERALGAVRAWDVVDEYGRPAAVARRHSLVAAAGYVCSCSRSPLCDHIRAVQNGRLAPPPQPAA